MHLSLVARLHETLLGIKKAITLKILGNFKLLQSEIDTLAVFDLSLTIGIFSLLAIAESQVHGFKTGWNS